MRTAGVVPFYNEDRYIIDKIQLYYADCLPQCFYTLRYTNYKNSVLLQKISHKTGFCMNDVIKILDLAFPHTKYEWKPLGYSPELLYYILHYDILKDNEATLVFLETANPSLLPNHFVVMYRKGNDVMIRDPQENARNPSRVSNYDLYNYLTSPDYIGIYMLTDTENQYTPYDGVKRKHICEVMDCELYEEKDRLKRKKLKVYTRKLNKYRKNLSYVEPELSNSNERVSSVKDEHYDSNDFRNATNAYNTSKWKVQLAPSWNNNVTAIP